MPRLFWKFFLIVWLTMTLTTLLAISIMHFSLLQNPRVRPFANVHQITAALLAERLKTGGPDDLLAFIKSKVPELTDVSLQITPEASPAQCSSSITPEIFAAVYNNQCYRIVVSRPEPWSLQNNWPHLFPWVTAIVASLFSAFALGKYLITPVARLRKGLRALAEGQFDIRIHDAVKNRRDEIAILTKDFDTSAARLQELHEGRQRLFHDISHELRSPLSRLQAVIGILRKNPSRLPSLLDRMDREIERLDGLVGEVLTLARLSSTGEKNDDMQVIDILDLVDNIVQDAAFEANEKNVKIAFNRDGEFVAMVNGELIYRAIENVIRNAVKYTAKGTCVEVKASVTPEELEVRISDQGPGVQQKDLESIFRPFTSSGASGTTSGYGLGLAITKTALQRHGGDVSATNKPEGGLSVTILLPKMAERE
jgi:signal transduction histidine kinase